MIQLAEHFSSEDKSRHSDWLRQQRWFVKARKDHERREEISDQLEEDALSLAADVIMATQIQIEEFEARLDAYDEATVIALMENQEKLDDINRRLSEVEIRIQDMLDRAYVMEDGRRVFLTADRTQAFDEQGTEISRDELDFGLVPKSNPTWESISGAFSEQDELLAEYKKTALERQQILEFQEKVDQARERVADGELTKDDLDDLDAELADAVPPSVKAHMPDFSLAKNAPKARDAFAAHANPTVSANIAPSTMAPQL